MTTTILTHDEQLAEDRQLLAAVGRWSRHAGWKPSKRMGEGLWLSPDETVAVLPVAEGGIRVWRDWSADDPSCPDYYPVRTVSEAVDVLAAIGVLPLELSSGWRAGAAASEVDPDPGITRVWSATGDRWDRDPEYPQYWNTEDGYDREWCELVLEEGPISTVPPTLIGGEPE